MPPNINDSTTISATVDSVVKASDRQQSIRLSRDATFTRTGNAARIHAQELMGKEKFAWDIDAIGDVRNVSFNRIKAYDTRREIQKKLAATGADTVLGDERKHLERAQSYIDQMVGRYDEGKRTFHYAHVMENYDLFNVIDTPNFPAAQAGQFQKDFLRQWADMQAETIGKRSIFKKYFTDSEPRAIAKEEGRDTFYVEKLYDIALPDGSMVQGRYFPHLGIGRFDETAGKYRDFIGMDDPITRKTAGQDYEPFFNRKLHMLIEEGEKTYGGGQGRVRYHNSPTFAATSFYQAIGGEAADQWGRKEMLQFLGETQGMETQNIVKRLWTDYVTTRGKKKPQKVPAEIEKADIKMFDQPQDALVQNTNFVDKEIRLVQSLKDIVKAASGRVVLFKAGIINTSRLLQKPSESEKRAITKTFASAKKRLPTEQNKLEEMRTSYSSGARSAAIKEPKLTKQTARLTDAETKLSELREARRAGTKSKHVRETQALRSEGKQPRYRESLSYSERLKLSPYERERLPSYMEEVIGKLPKERIKGIDPTSPAYTKKLDDLILREEAIVRELRPTVVDTPASPAYKLQLREKIGEQEDLVRGLENILETERVIDKIDPRKITYKPLKSVGRKAETPTQMDDLMRLEKQFPGMDIDVLRKTDLTDQEEVLQKLLTFADTKIGELKAAKASQRSAFKLRAKNVKHAKEIEVQVPGGGYINFGDKHTKDTFLKGLNMSPEAEELGKFMKPIYDLNRTFRLLATGFDVGAAWINGLRWLFTPGGAGGFRKLIFGTFADVFTGNVNGNAWLAEKAARQPKWMRDAKMRGRINVEAQAEQVEMLNKDFMKGVPGRETVGTILSTVGRKTDESMPGGSVKNFLRGVKNAPLAAVKAYTASVNLIVEDTFELLYYQIPKTVAKKMNVKDIRDIPPERFEEARLLFRKYEQELGDYANKAAGKLTNEASGGLSQLTLKHNVGASFLMFAPRFFASQISLTNDLLRGELKGDLARKSMARLLGGASTFYIASSLLLGQEPKIDPRPKTEGGDGGDFFTLEINGVKVSLAGSANAIIKTLVNSYGQLRKGTIKPEEFKPDPENNIFIKFFTNRTAPVLGTGLEIWSGRSYAGQDIEWGDGITDPRGWRTAAGLISADMMPFWSQGLRDLSTPDWGSKLTGAGFEFIGLSAYASSPWNTVSELKNLTAESMFGAEFYEHNGYRPTWDDMDSFQRARIVADYPEITEAEQAAKEIWGDRAFSNRQATINDYVEDVRIIQEEFDDDYDALIDEVINGILSPTGDIRNFGKEFRNERAYLHRKKASDIQDLKDNDYPEIQEFFDESRSEEKNIPLFNLAHQAYLDEVVYNKDLEMSELEGGYNFDLADEIKQDFITRWGQDMHDAIEQMFELTHTEQHWLEREFRWGRKLPVVKAYWNVPYTILETQGLEGLRTTWDMYDRLKESSDYLERAEAKMMEETIPELKHIRSMRSKVRDQMRERDPVLDHFMYKFGYTSTVLHQDNLERNGTLGIPLSLLKLDIPYPEWLIKAVNNAQLDNNDNVL